MLWWTSCLMNSKKDFMAGISTQVGFIICCKNRASARLCLSSQASFMAHFDHIGFARSNHGTSSTEAMGGGHSFGFDVTSLRGLAPSHPHTDVQENLQCYSLWSIIDCTLNWGLPRVVLFNWSSREAAF